MYKLDTHIHSYLPNNKGSSSNRYSISMPPSHTIYLTAKSQSCMDNNPNLLEFKIRRRTFLMESKIVIHSLTANRIRSINPKNHSPKTISIHSSKDKSLKML
ncbi:hypothetical protein JOD45_002293 [Scopulibacillus daqui]|uniref:Uncharacterized protein n=1 Tax=Scopulibacillus daqui TaxID=1469162 RepID=A0ABS2Q195_9BACL|nr:hypothetical protein [Scopulibacillus daqui]